MKVLMLRLDVFEEQHEDLQEYWQTVIESFIKTPVDVSTFVFKTVSEEDISQAVLSSYLHEMCESYASRALEIDEMYGAQCGILMGLNISGLPEDKEKIASQFVDIYGLYESEKQKEYYELEESRDLTIRDRNNISIMIEKEMKKFWNHIDTLIIDSYKRILYDITGSDNFVQSFMKELLRYGMKKDLSIAKRDRDYDGIINVTNALDSCIGDWVCDIEQLVGAPQ